MALGKVDRVAEPGLVSPYRQVDRERREHAPFPTQVLSLHACSIRFKLTRPSGREFIGDGGGTHLA